MTDTQRDPISGRWGKHGVNFLELAFDGARAITGHVMDGRPDRRASIAAGSFDRATGALHLEGIGVHQQTGVSHPYVIHGLLRGNELAVTATFGDWSGSFTFTKRGARWPWLHAFLRTIRQTVARLVGRRREEGDDESAV